MAKLKESKAIYSAETITTVTAQGKTEIPRALRQRYRVGPKSRLRWTDTGKGLLIVPFDESVVPTDRSRRGKKAINAPASKRKELRAIRPENREAIRILRKWMHEPDEWTNAQWDEFESELQTRRLSFRKPQ
jgi:bifunctional DNA-binding transcriptional regulator/antitoxin component of YhaV-PrlF toxin-antitoxin module